MPAQMGYPDAGCQSCGPKAKGSSHGQSGKASGATEQGDAKEKDAYKTAQ